MDSIIKVLDWIGFKYLIEKWRIAKVLQEYKKDIEKEKKEADHSDCHRWLGAQGEVILQSNIYFNQGIRNIIINWKDRIDKKANNVEWEKELDILSGIVENIIKGLRVWLGLILIVVNLVTIGYVTYVVSWFVGK